MAHAQHRVDVEWQLTEVPHPGVAIGLVQGVEILLICVGDGEILAHEPGRALCAEGSAGKDEIGHEGIPDELLSGFPALFFTFGCEDALIITLTRLFTSGLRVTE